MNCIFICVFHNPNYVYLCKLLLNSISQFGELTDEHILIYTTDKLKSEIEKIAPTDLPIFYETNNKIETKQQACHARIDFFTLPTVIRNRYNKVAYLDTDILVVRPIKPLFELITKPIIYALEEGILEKDTIVKHGGFDYWGASLFGMSFPQYEGRSAFSSGILLFPNIPMIEFVFQQIKTISNTVSNPYLHGFGQPYIVYCCMVMECYDNQELKKYATYGCSFEKWTTLPATTLLVHFAGGVGLHINKQAQMEEFYGKICEANKISIPAGIITTKADDHRPTPTEELANPDDELIETKQKLLQAEEKNRQLEQELEKQKMKCMLFGIV